MLLSSINPSSASYWVLVTFLPLTTTVNTENLLFSEIHLTTNKLYYSQTFTQSNEVTLATLARKYVSDFKYFNIDLYYNDGVLYSDLIYPTQYAQVNFYPGSLGSQSYGSLINIYEQNVGILETLTPEVNQNISYQF
jgi:hypothetical protein